MRLEVFVHWLRRHLNVRCKTSPYCLVNSLMVLVSKGLRPCTVIVMAHALYTRRDARGAIVSLHEALLDVRQILHLFCTWCLRNASYDEAKQLPKRYLQFDLEKLIKKAVSLVQSRGASYCNIRIIIATFCGTHQWFGRYQGFEVSRRLYNKALILTMDNGIEILAKLPCPAAGPQFYTTASEVTTRSFVSLIPRWSIAIISANTDWTAFRYVENSLASHTHLVCRIRQSNRRWIQHRRESGWRASG